jgi:hypothetical protein
MAAGASQGNTWDERAKNAVMGYMAGVGAKKFGPSLGAKGLGAMEKMLAGTGKYSRMLQSAFERGGPTAVASSHFLMVQNHPEYKAEYEKASEETNQ